MKGPETLPQVLGICQCSSRGSSPHMTSAGLLVPGLITRTSTNAGLHIRTMMSKRLYKGCNQ